MLHRPPAWRSAGIIVSISALSDRGLLLCTARTPTCQAYCFNIRSFGSWIASRSAWHTLCQGAGFNIRSFGSWIASHHVKEDIEQVFGFNIRSFGSWIASSPATNRNAAARMFQYPLFRIVDCFSSSPGCHRSQCPVSISALSDRGLLLPALIFFAACGICFNIRSFGSWIASTGRRVASLSK